LPNFGRFPQDELMRLRVFSCGSRALPTIHSLASLAGPFMELSFF
jgi:hypothetical protein